MLRFVWLLITLISGIVASGDYGEEGGLVTQLLQSYDKKVRPVRSFNTTTVVQLQFALSKVESLDAHTEVLTTHGWIIVTWYDEFLTWNPVEHFGITEIVITSDNIWIPEIALKNSADNGNDLSLNVDQLYRVVVSHDGLVQWVPMCKWTTTCSIDVTYFPFDVQRCRVIFANWIYTAHQVNLTLAAPTTLNLKEFSNNSEWLLVGHDMGRYDSEMHYSPAKSVILPVVWFELRLARTPTVYVVDILFVAAVLAAMVLVMFLMPPDASDKVVLGVTILLAYTVLMLLINDATPKTDNLPIMLMVMCTDIFNCALCTLCEILVLQIHNHPPLKPIPAWARKLFLGKLAKVLHVTIVTGEIDAAVNHKNHSPYHASETGSLTFNRKVTMDTMMMSAADEHPGDDDDTKGILHPWCQRCSDLQESKKMLPSYDSKMLDDVRDYLKLRKQLIAAKEKRCAYEDEWRDLARVIDRFFLCFWTVAIGLSAIVLLFMFFHAAPY